MGRRYGPIQTQAGHAQPETEATAGSAGYRGICRGQASGWKSAGLDPRFLLQGIPKTCVDIMVSYSREVKDQAGCARHLMGATKHSLYSLVVWEYEDFGGRNNLIHFLLFYAKGASG